MMLQQTAIGLVKVFIRGLVLATAFVWPAAASIQALAQTAVTAPAPAAAQVGSATDASPVSSQYVIQPNDQLSVVVLGHDDLKSDVTVLPDGSFTVPVAGTIHAAGLNIAQVTAALVRAYSYELNKPQVSVVVHQVQQQQISVLGTVKLPGQFTYHPGMRVLDALAAAGGATQDTAQTSINLVSVSAGTTQLIRGGSLIDETASEQNVIVHPGDVLIVEQADPAATQVQISGEVQHPGFVSVPTTGATLQTVVNAAGGFTPAAAQGHVQIQHGSQTRNVSVNADTLSGQALSGVLVYPGDSVTVPTNERKFAVLGEVHSPGAFAIPDNGSVTVTAALIMAGGTTTEADKMRANILRRLPDGKAQAIPVNVASILKGSASAPDLMLLPGDILYIPTHSQKGVDAGNFIGILPGFSYLLR